MARGKYLSLEQARKQKQHGQDAPIHAAMRADAMLDKGDLDGYAVWKRILRAVEELQGAEPAARVH